jgi:hypothetical protein
MKILFHGIGGDRHVTDATGRGEWLKTDPCQAAIPGEINQWRISGNLTLVKELSDGGMPGRVF